MNVLPSQFVLLRRSLDLASERQRVIGQNMANVNTPGYKAKQVGFEQSLHQLLGEGDEALSRAEFQITPTGDATNRRDKNNVDIDRELGKLNKNALLFKAMTELLQLRLSEMRSAMDLR